MACHSPPPPRPPPLAPPQAPLLPGAARLVAHLRASGVPLALATSTSRATLALKMAGRDELAAAFAHACCGDEVALGKPHPECFVEIARRVGVHPAECLVIGG